MLDAMMDFADPARSARGAAKRRSTELCSFGAPRSSFLELFSGAPLAEFRGALFWSSFLELRWRSSAELRQRSSEMELHGAPLAELRGAPRSSAELRRSSAEMVGVGGTAVAGGRIFPYCLSKVLRRGTLPKELFCGTLSEELFRVRQRALWAELLQKTSAELRGGVSTDLKEPL
eukprot:gene17973-biopygen7282